MTSYTDTFFVIDFDRCTGDTDKLYSVLESVVEDQSPAVANQMSVAKAEVESRGETFDSAKYLRTTLPGDEWYEIERTFIRKAQTGDMLLPHSRELFAILDDRNIPYGIVTYGHETWQLAKLEAAGMLKIPRLITQVQEKSLLLSGWKHGEMFIIPPALTPTTPLQVKQLVFLDDKAISFQGLPEGVLGVHVKSPSGKVLPVQMGPIPEGVRDVIGIQGAIELLFG